jgi:hypothetical protein
MLAFDASAIIYGWDNYPIAKFPKLWEWMEHQIGAVEFAIPDVAYDEVEHVAPDCHAWLEAAGISVIDSSDESLQFAQATKQLLGIVGDKYHPNGVGENDLLIIACARVNACHLVSNEGLQNDLPNVMAKYKIPAVCKHASVSVPCQDFLQLIKSTTATF